MNDRSRRLLAVNWDMPPLSGPRAVQVSQTLNALVPLGWESSVICFGPRSNRYGQDQALAAGSRRGVTRLPVPSLEERFAFRALWRLVPRLKIMPDEKWVWIRAAVRAARRAASERRFDVLVSFAQPWSDHLIGLKLRRLLGAAVGRAFQRSLGRQSLSSVFNGAGVAASPVAPHGSRRRPRSRRGGIRQSPDGRSGDAEVPGRPGAARSRLCPTATMAARRLRRAGPRRSARFASSTPAGSTRAIEPRSRS